MSAKTKPLINLPTTITWNSRKACDLKPMVFSSISQASSIPRLISYLKEAFPHKEFSLVQGILMDHQKHLWTKIQNLKRDFDSVKTTLHLAEMLFMKISTNTGSFTIHLYNIIILRFQMF
uniref:Putative ovule protein n=1 Tax=Solanum chacoense TaxID=4108 RepID=A0A0V0HJK1_SOLCH